MSSHYNNAQSNDTSHRRKWDKGEFLKKAEEREKAAEAVDEARASGKKVPIVGKVKGEEGTVMESVPERKDIQDFEARIGRTQVMASAAGVGGSKQQQAGFYCEICNMTLKDNVGYLDHVNGRQHMILAGVSLQTERSSVEDVRERLAWLKRKKDNPDVAYDIEAIVAKAQEVEKVEREAKKERKKIKKEAKKEEKIAEMEEFIDTDVALLMGFGGFGGSGARVK